MKFIFRGILNSLIFLLTLLYCQPDSKSPEKANITPEKSDSVEISIDWEYKDLPLKMEIREPSGLRPLELWTTDVVQNLQNAPFSAQIPENKFQLPPGGKKSFVLTMTNSGTEDIYFFAAPHIASPVEHSLGFKFKCLCVNHVFHVPIGSTWYRAVEFKLSDHFLGNRLIVSHTLLGTTKDRLGD